MRKPHENEVTVSGLLAGFSFTGAIELLPTSKNGLAQAASLFLFLGAAVLFLIATFGLFVSAEWAESNKTSSYEDTWYDRFAGQSFGYGIIVFALGIGSLGFIHSTIGGIVSTAAALFIIVYFFIATITISRAK
jgi:hypothetical protein